MGVIHRESGSRPVHLDAHRQDAVVPRLRPAEGLVVVDVEQFVGARLQHACIARAGAVVDDRGRRPRLAPVYAEDDVVAQGWVIRNPSVAACDHPVGEQVQPRADPARLQWPGLARSGPRRPTWMRRAAGASPNV